MATQRPVGLTVREHNLYKAFTEILRETDYALGDDSRHNLRQAITTIAHRARAELIGLSQGDAKNADEG